MQDNNNNKYVEPPLYVAEIDKALQKPQTFLYVPMITVFLPEMFFLLGGIALIGFWVVIFIPLHLVFIINTNLNIFWVEDMITNFFEISIAGNKGLKGKNVVTYAPITDEKQRRNQKL